MTGLLTVSQAAEALGLDRTTLIHQIRNGRLTATRLGPIYVLTEAEVERYRTTSLGRSGRPRKVS